jgi:Beta-lactamase enzyme family
VTITAIAVSAGLGVLASCGGSDSDPTATVGVPAERVRVDRERREHRGRRKRPEHRAAARRHARIARAADWAGARDGRVAFAIAGPDGAIHGRNEHELFQSASVVKTLILAAELQRVADSGDRLTPAVAAELRQMITVSDNRAATSVFARVGPEGLDAIAHRAGMRDFRSSTSWGASEISAADMAAMFAAPGRVLPERYEKFGLGLLGSIADEQRWGIARIAGERGWNVRFKGGWRLDPDGQIVNQAAELRRDGAERAIAVLTDRQPSMGYGIETVEGITARLLRG